MKTGYTIHEAARLSGVTVRTLHHYDHIGLLCPQVDPDNGYRIYTKAELEKLQQILFFRELDFPLREIRNILEHPGFDSRVALARQKELLLEKRTRLDGLIALIDENLKGEPKMNFNAFDTDKIEAHKAEYKAEVEQRWGHTAAYKDLCAELLDDNRRLPEATEQSSATLPEGVLALVPGSPLLFLLALLSFRN